MAFKKTKKNKYINIALPIVVFLLLFVLMFFAVKSLKIVFQTNKHNFAYTIKVRESSEEISNIFERAETSINVLNDDIAYTYDINQKYNEEYNSTFLKNLMPLTKSTLLNCYGTDGIWFQLNTELPFSNKEYVWLAMKNNKSVDLRKERARKHIIERKLSQKEDSYYYEAVKAKKTIWSNIYRDSDTKTPMLTIASPVYKNQYLIGVVGIDISVNNLQNALKNVQNVFKGSEIFLLDNKYNIILFKLLEEGSPSNYAFIDLFKKKPQNTDALVGYKDGKVNKTAIRLILTTKYNLVVTFANMHIFNGFNNLFRAISLIFIIMTGLAIAATVNKKNLIDANKNLQNEKNKFLAIFDSSPNFIVIKDSNGVYQNCNEQFLNITGFTKEDFVGKTDYDFFSKEEAEDILANDEIVKRTKKASIHENYYSTKTGKKLYIEKFVVPILDTDENLVCLFILGIDITQKRREKDLLQKAKDEAEKATELKSNFLANMSHEIRTPLNGILGFIQLLKDTRITEEQIEFINNVQKSSEVLLNVINDILDFSKIEANKLKIDNISFDLRSLIEDITLMSTSTAELKGLEINSLIYSDVPQKVFGDPGRIKQILTNLVSNAIKFTEKGEVIIYVKQIWEDFDHSVVIFKVKDTGIGIAEENLKSIFESFTQADASTTRHFGGTGLGLTISKQLAFLMNGNIYVKSKLGDGSTFMLTLPFKKDRTENSELENCSNFLDGRKILVLNHNKTDFKIIRHYLKDLNCIASKANTIEETFNIIDNDNQNISAILVDYKMRKHLEKEYPSIFKKNIPMILYANLAHRGDAIAAREKGYAGYITKPIKKDELVETISAAIRNQYENKKQNFVTKHFVKEYKFNSKSKILVVEDSEINCKLIFRILNNHGLTCEFAKTGEEAIAAFKEKEYDLILMDCQMPIMDGYEATKIIRKLEHGSMRTPIIAMTANSMLKDKTKCFAVGMNDFISKPINIDDLLILVSKYLNLNPEQDEKSLHNIENSEEANEIQEIISEMVKELEFDRAEAINLFREYLEVLPEAILELHNAIEQSDFAELKKIAHKLKGSSANLRIEKIAQLSILLEKQANNEDRLSCKNTINDIKTHLEYLNILCNKFTTNVNII